jgi:hypothetical protein
MMFPWHESEVHMSTKDGSTVDTCWPVQPLPLPAKSVRLSEIFLEAKMVDKDKNVIEQIVDTVNDFVEIVANTASDALDKAMEQTAARPDEQPISDDVTHANDVGLRSDERADEEGGQTAIHKE